MAKSIIGINFPGSSNILDLEKTLKRIQDDGFDCCEINLATFPMIIGGEMQTQVVDFVADIFKKQNLVYTAHIGYGLDMYNLEEQNMHNAVLMSSIDICEKLNVQLLNLHYEEQTKFSKREEAFLKAHLKASDYAEKRNVKLSIENIEVELMHKTVDFVKKANHNNLGMNLDLGHLFLSAEYFGYDFMQAVHDAIPYLVHLHINDNVGIFEPMRISDQAMYDTISKNYRMAFGRGDIHIPPFWGKAKLKEALQAIKLSGYSGKYICEYNSNYFLPFNKSVQEKVRLELE